jgi:hypothetical protein
MILNERKRNFQISHTQTPCRVARVPLDFIMIQADTNPEIIQWAMCFAAWCCQTADQGLSHT